MGLVTTELLKLRTQRSMVVLLLFAILMPIVRMLLFGLGARVSDVSGFDLASELVQRQQLLSTAGGTTLIVVLAILGITGEYRHRTITWSFLATPERHKVIFTKFFVYVVMGLLYGILVAGIVTLGVMLLLAIEGVSLTVPWSIILGDYAREIAGIGFAVGLGFLVGALLVNQIAAIVVVVVEPVASNIVMGLFPKVGRFLPTPASRGALAEQTFLFDGFLSRTASTSVLVGYLLLLVGAAIYLTQRRDVT